MNIAEKYIAETIEDPVTGEQVRFPEFYHAEGAKMIKDLERVLIADDMGVGKTAVPVLGHYMLKDEDPDLQSLVIQPGHIRNQWEESIQEYTSVEPEIYWVESTDPRDLEVGDADFTLVNYGKLRQSAPGDEEINNLAEELTSYGFDLLTIDEAHRVRNSGANQTQNITSIAEQVPYLCMLTGTPIYNEFQDAFQLLYLLEHENYDSPEDVKARHRKQPDVVSSIMDTRSRRLESGEVINDFPEFDPIKRGENTVDFRGTEHQEVYKAVLENDMLSGREKLLQLRKAIQDPELVDESIEVDNPQIDGEIPVVFDDELRNSLDSIESQKYRKVEQEVENLMEKGEKVVIYTKFKEGVVEKLQDRLGEDVVHTVTGDHNIDDRQSRVDEFEQGDYTALLATVGAAGEGFEITGARNIMFLEEPWTPAKINQCRSRVHRRGQDRIVREANLRAEMDIPNIDEGKWENNEQKRDLIEFFLEGADVSDEIEDIENQIDAKGEEIAELFEGESRAVMADYMYTDRQKAFFYSVAHASESVENIKQSMYKNDGEIGRSFAEKFTTRWETSYSANLARAYSKILTRIGPDEPSVIDIGSAFGPLAEVSDLDPVNVDINRFNFQEEIVQSRDNARKVESSEGDQLKMKPNVVGSMHNLPVADSSLDMALSSLSLHYNSPFSNQGEKSEREVTVEEANRVLKPGGKYLVALPASLMGGESREELNQGLKEKGFRPIQELTGFVRAEDPNVDFHAYIATAEKQGEPSEETGDWFHVEKNRESPRPTSGTDKRAHNFEIKTLNGEKAGLEEMINRHLS